MIYVDIVIDPSVSAFLERKTDEIAVARNYHPLNAGGHLRCFSTFLGYLNAALRVME